MPEQARILQFPGRSSASRRSAGEALEAAQNYLSLDIDDRERTNAQEVYRDLDVLLAVCGLLRERNNSVPADVLKESARIYAWVSNQVERLGYFDERDYFLGESALLAGTACRVLGERAETELWLDRADANYRHTINPAASLARVAYVRLTLRFDTGRYHDVLELLPSTALTFEKLGMYSELGKCRFLEAMTLKELARYAESATRLQGILSESVFQSDPAIRGMAMLNLGNIRSLEGDQEQALESYKAAQPLLEAGRRFAMLADLKGMVAETLRHLGQLASAIAAYREAVSDYVELGIQTKAAYSRVLLSEALLEAGRPREAEWELLSALPTINEQQMVPEGFAAVALLQESIKHRKTDSKALADLRRHLQASN